MIQIVYIVRLLISCMLASTQHIPLNLTVNLDVPDSIILSRISDRWVHLPSGRVYNMSYNRPKVEGLDDETGEPLTKRPDDNPVRFVTFIINPAFTDTLHVPLYRKLSPVAWPSFTPRHPRYFHIMRSKINNNRPRNLSPSPERPRTRSGRYSRKP